MPTARVAELKRIAGDILAAAGAPATAVRSRLSPLHILDAQGRQAKVHLEVGWGRP